MPKNRLSIFGHFLFRFLYDLRIVKILGNLDKKEGVFAVDVEYMK